MDYAKRRSKTLHYVFTNFEKIEEIELNQGAGKIITRINSDLKNLLEMAQRENVGKVLYEFIKQTGYLQKLEKEGSSTAESKIQNIAKFFDKIKEFIDLSQSETTRAFVDYLEIMRNAGEDPATAPFDPDLDAVNVMTVHAAKGLEFKVVFMVGLVDDRFPSRERGEPLSLPDELIKETLPTGDYHVQEERRLFYVGTTRARDKLYYTWSADAGGKRLKKVSPFVLEALDRPNLETTKRSVSYREKIEQFVDHKTPSTLPKEPEIIRLTQASIDDYETCAYKYRYAHVLRVPILRHHTVIYGFALHSAVAEFYRQKMVGRILNLEAMLAVLENAWVSEGFLTAEHEERRLIHAKEVIKNFWLREKDSQDLPNFIEKDFRFNLNGGDTKVLVNGRFDRVDVTGKKARIIDFKSTEGRSEEDLIKAAKASVQMKIYTLGYYKNYRVIPEFVGIYDLDSGIIGGYEPKEKELKETEEEVIEVAKKIRLNFQSDNFPANPKYFGRVPACNYCAYNSICPFSLANK
jgi:DNA helicase-2/ATP-dependent DNA helicase PcrA